MIDHATCGVLTATTRTGIDALVVQACLAAIAVRVGHAFRPAGDVRIAKVLRQTRARSNAVPLVANGVRTARRRIARRARLLRRDRR